MTLSKETRLRLQFLSRFVKRELNHLLVTSKRLFRVDFNVELANKLDQDVELSERLDAFVARFCRLQDTLGYKLLPQLLIALNEITRTQVDNLDKAERLGWITSVDQWLSIRQLRNQMVHEYIEDTAVLVSAVTSPQEYVDELQLTAIKMLDEISSRDWM